MPVIAHTCQVIQLLAHTPANQASRCCSGSVPSCAVRMNSVKVKSVMKKPSAARLPQRFIGEIRAQRRAVDHEAQVGDEAGGDDHPERRAGGDQRQRRELRRAGVHQQRHHDGPGHRQAALDHGDAADQAPGRRAGQRMQDGALTRRETPRDAAGSVRAHQSPVLAIDTQGSRGGSEPSFCSSSMEMLSGERTKAMRPSRGGRLMVTPCFCRRSQAA